MAFLKDIDGNNSSKRLVGISGIVVCLGCFIYAIKTATAADQWATVESLIQWGITVFSGLLLGGSSVEFISKYFSKGKKEDDKPE